MGYYAQKYHLEFILNLHCEKVKFHRKLLKHYSFSPWIYPQFFFLFFCCSLIDTYSFSFLIQADTGKLNFILIPGTKTCVKLFRLLLVVYMVWKNLFINKLGNTTKQPHGIKTKRETQDFRGMNFFRTWFNLTLTLCEL